MTRLLAVAVILLAGCGSDAPPIAARASTTERATAAVSAPEICGATSDGPAPSMAALAALGEPRTEDAFDLSEPLTKFRVRLLDHYVLPRDERVRVRERSWAKGSCRLTVWLTEREGTFRPVDWLRWNEGDVF